MKVDLLRQLDEWGTHLEDGIDHVESTEVLEGVSSPAVEVARVRLRSRWSVPVAALGATAMVVVVAVVGWSFLSSVEDRSRGEEFSSVGSVDGVDRSSLRRNALTTTSAPPTTAAPTTAAPTTTSAPATTAAPAPTTTLPPAPESTVPPVGGNPSQLGRDVIFVGDLTIDSRDVAGSVAAARAIVESRGGYVFAQELGGDSTVVSLKVPAEFFQDTVDRLSELGTVRSARVTSQDVTERIVDLESQIVTSQTSVSRLQQLLSEADTINTITKLEAELLDRETALERLRGQLRTLRDQVALSTIVITIRQFVPHPELVVAVTVRPTDGGFGDDCFTRSRPRIPEGNEYVLCVDITNAGNLNLTDVEVSGADGLLGDLRPVTGQPVVEMAPGDRYTLWTTGVAADSLREEITVQAVPLGEERQRLVESTVEDRAQLRITVPDQPEPQPEPVEEDEGLPPLGDALSNGWAVLTTVANALAVVVAFALPFLWIPLLFGLALWWRRRKT